MKTHLVLALLGLTAAVRAQDNVVDFRNGLVPFPTPADRYVYRDFVGGEKLSGTNYVAGLWYVPGEDLAAVDGRISPDRGQQAGSLAFFRSVVSVNRGIWLLPAGVSSLFPLNGLMPGQVASLQVRVWDSLKFSSFSAAFAAEEFGASAPFTYRIPAPPATPDSYYMDNLRAFALTTSGRRISIENIVVAEGSNGVVQANFTVTMAQAQAVPVSVDYATQDGTALAASDYVATNGTVTFAPGEIARVISVTLTADAPPEEDEIFYLNLGNPVNGVLEKAQATCTITEIRIAGVSIDTSVSFNTVAGHRYMVERTNNTLDWEPVPGATNVLGTGEIVSIIDRGSGCQPMRVYRARLLLD